MREVEGYLLITAPFAAKQVMVARESVLPQHRPPGRKWHHKMTEFRDGFKEEV